MKGHDCPTVRDGGRRLCCVVLMGGGSTEWCWHGADAPGAHLEPGPDLSHTATGHAQKGDVLVGGSARRELAVFRWWCTAVNGEVLRVASYRFRATFEHRRGGYLTLVLLVGLVGGLAMGALSAARRTQSSFSTYLASTNPSDLSVSIFGGFGNGGGWAWADKCQQDHLRSYLIYTLPGYTGLCRSRAVRERTKKCASRSPTSSRA